MIIPDISRIRLRLSLLEILGESGWLKQTAAKLADFYLKLGGDPGLRWSEQTSLQEIVVGLEEKVNDLVMARLQPALDKGVTEEECLTVYVSRADGEFTLDWRPIVVIWHRSIFCMFTGFLDLMKRQKPQLARLIGQILAAVATANMVPLSTLPAIEEFFEEWYEAESEDNGEACEILKEMKLEKKAFAARVKQMAFKDVPDRIKKLEKSYARMKNRLAKHEKAWIENALALLNVSASIGKMDFREPEDLSLDPASTDNFYALLGEPYSQLSEMWEENVQSVADNCCEPCDIVEVSGLEDLENLGRYIETITRLQRLLFDGGSLYAERNDQK